VSRPADILLTALAPIVWGSTYLTTTELLPPGYPLTAALLRALPAGGVLLVITRRWPQGVWLWRVLILGGLNFAIFLPLLYVAAYRLPGGVAATVGAVYPLMTALLAWPLLGQRVSRLTVWAGVGGVIGVALIALNHAVALDAVGVMAALANTVVLALGIVLTQKWRPPVSALVFTAWQMTAGGLLLMPLTLIAEPVLPAPTAAHVLGFAYLAIIGGAMAYFLWFRGIARLGSTATALLGFLSPVSAALLGLAFLQQTFTVAQMVGIALVISSVWVGAVRPGVTAPPIAARGVAPTPPPSSTPGCFGS